MTTWKSVPLMMTPAMHAAAAAAARQYAEATGGNNLDVIWAAALQAAPDKPAGHELEIIVTDRNNTYSARPRPGMATEKAGLQGTSASYTGGRIGAVYRLLEKSSRRLHFEQAEITPMLPEAGDPSDCMRYSVVVMERGA